MQLWPCSNIRVSWLRPNLIKQKPRPGRSQNETHRANWFMAAVRNFLHADQTKERSLPIETRLFNHQNYPPTEIKTLGFYKIQDNPRSPLYKFILLNYYF